MKRADERQAAVVVALHGSSCREFFDSASSLDEKN